MGECSKSWDFVVNRVGAVYNGKVRIIMGGCNKLWEDVLNRVGAVYNGRVQLIIGGCIKPGRRGL